MEEDQALPARSQADGQGSGDADDVAGRDAAHGRRQGEVAATSWRGEDAEAAEGDQRPHRRTARRDHGAERRMGRGQHLDRIGPGHPHPLVAHQAEQPGRGFGFDPAGRALEDDEANARHEDDGGDPPSHSPPPVHGPSAPSRAAFGGAQLRAVDVELSSPPPAHATTKGVSSADRLVLTQP